MPVKIENQLQTPPLPKKESFWKRNKTLLWVGAIALGTFATWQVMENQKRGTGSPPESPSPPEARPTEVRTITN